MASEPCMNDAVAAQAFVDATGDGLHLRQFRHFIIVGDQLCMEWSFSEVRQ
jgi:hypothetical protein